MLRTKTDIVRTPMAFAISHHGPVNRLSSPTYNNQPSFALNIAVSYIHTRTYRAVYDNVVFNKTTWGDNKVTKRSQARYTIFCSSAVHKWKAVIEDILCICH